MQFKMKKLIYVLASANLLNLSAAALAQEGSPSDDSQGASANTVVRSTG